MSMVGIQSAEEIGMDVDRIYNQTQNSSKVCLMDFKLRNCNPLNLDNECQKIYDCIKEEPDDNYI